MATIHRPSTWPEWLKNMSDDGVKNYFEENPGSKYNPNKQKQKAPENKAPNVPGKVTENPNFQKWFKGSAVVDKLGQPMVVYHGSPDARFMKKDGVFRRLTVDGYKETDGVFWFTPDRATANTYADDTRAFDYQSAEAGVIPAYLRMLNPMEVDGEGKEWREAQARGKTSDVIEEAVANGHDGIIIRNVRDSYSGKGKPVDTFAVFNAKQIKSADKNTGDFDMDNPSVLAKVHRPSDWPDWLKNKSDKSIEQYFKQNPGSKYNPNKKKKSGGAKSEPTKQRVITPAYDSDAVFFAEERFGDAVAPNGKTIAQNFLKWSNGIVPKDFSEDGEHYGWPIEDGEPLLVEAFHGTLSDFDTFDRDKTHKNSFHGKGFYFSSTSKDTDTNYSNTEGPDFLTKKDNLAEQLRYELLDGHSNLLSFGDEKFQKELRHWAEQENYDLEDDGDLGSFLDEIEVSQKLEDMIHAYAGRELGAQNRGATMKSFVKFIKPAIMSDNDKFEQDDGSRQTFLELTYVGDPDDDDFDFSIDWDSESARVLTSVHNQLGDSGYDFDISFAYDGGFTLNRLLTEIAEQTNYDPIYDDDGDEKSPAEVMAEALRSVGYDGIVELSPDRFNMKGIDKYTRHFIAFSPEQIKSATGNSGDFDPKNKKVTANVYRPTNWPDWLKNMSDEGVKNYFEDNPGSKYNPNRKKKKPAPFVRKLPSAPSGVVSYAKETFGDKIAPNGKLVAKNFANWFGGSKVVDADGKPEVMYHGSPTTDIDSFEHGSTAYGIFFTPDPDTAEYYAGHGGKIYEVYLKAENIADFDDPEVFEKVMREAVDYTETREEDDALYFAKRLFDEGFEKSKAVRNFFENMDGFDELGDGYDVVDLMRDNFTDVSEIEDLVEAIGTSKVRDAFNKAAPSVSEELKAARDAYGSQDFYMEFQDDFMRAAQNMGYDAVSFTDPSSTGNPSSFVVFNREQIKSKENDGDFDKESPEILAHLSPLYRGSK